MTKEERLEKDRARSAAYRKAYPEKSRASCAAWRKANPDKAFAARATWRKANPEKAGAATAAWHKANPEKVYAKIAAWQKAHPEKVRARHAAYRKANPEKIRTSNAAWYKAHPEKAKARNSNLKAKRRGAEGRHTGEEIRRLLARQKCLCAVCKKSIEAGYHKDHIVPLSRGGSNYIRNIQLLCPKCNLKKGNKHPVKFMQEMGFLL